MSNNVFDLISTIEEAISASPKPRLGTGNKRVVDCDYLLDLLGDLKILIPEQVRQAQAVLIDKDSVLEEANMHAAAMMSEARVASERMVSREGVIAEAKIRAEAIVDRAEQNAELIAQGARSYTDDILGDVQRYLREYVEIIERNRMELHQVYHPVGGEIDDDELKEMPETKTESPSEPETEEKENKVDEKETFDDSISKGGIEIEMSAEAIEDLLSGKATKSQGTKPKTRVEEPQTVLSKKRMKSAELIDREDDEEEEELGEYQRYTYVELEDQIEESFSNSDDEDAEPFDPSVFQDYADEDEEDFERF